MRAEKDRVFTPFDYDVQKALCPVPNISDDDDDYEEGLDYVGGVPQLSEGLVFNPHNRLMRELAFKALKLINDELNCYPDSTPDENSYCLSEKAPRLYHVAGENLGSGGAAVRLVFLTKLIPRSFKDDPFNVPVSVCELIIVVNAIVQRLSLDMFFWG